MVQGCHVFLLVYAFLPQINSNPIGHGLEVNVVDSPWHVQINLRNTSEYLCGGTLLTTIRVLTAAHCKVSDELYVFVGHRHTNGFDAADTVSIRHFVVHPNYTSQVVTFDVAVVILERRVARSELVWPMELNSDLKVPQVGDRFQIVGNGMTILNNFREPSAYRLKAVGTVSVCNDTRLVITDEMQPYVMCLQFENMTGTCKGDSGGGIILNTRLLVGVDVVGSSCGTDLAIGFAVNVASVYEWITNVKPTFY